MLTVMESEAIAFGGVLVGIIALGFAFKQFKDAHNTLTGLQAVDKTLSVTASSLGGVQTQLGTTAQNLDFIRDSLTTVGVGKAPEFVPHIIRTVRAATTHLRILCDHPGYAIFSRPDEFDSYLAALHNARSRPVDVEIICLDKTHRSELHTDQFSQARTGDWADWRSKRTELIRRLLERPRLGHFAPDGSAPHSIELPIFLSALEQVHDKVWETMGGIGLVRRELRERPPIYFWIADEGPAIISFVTYDDQAIEVAFRTSDPTLIRALLGIWRHYQGVSSPVTS